MFAKTDTAMMDSRIGEYLDTFEATLADPLVRQMDQYTHHGDSSTFMHCLYVSYTSYRIACVLNMKRRSEIGRGALLHDLFLYDWHTHKGEGLHAFTHGRSAFENASAGFDLSEVEKEMILKHMWPLNPSPPRHAATYLLVFTDKYCSLMDTLGMNKRFRECCRRQAPELFAS